MVRRSVCSKGEHQSTHSLYSRNIVNNWPHIPITNAFNTTDKACKNYLGNFIKSYLKYKCGNNPFGYPKGPNI